MNNARFSAFEGLLLFVLALGPAACSSSAANSSGADGGTGHGSDAEAGFDATSSPNRADGSTAPTAADGSAGDGGDAAPACSAGTYTTSDYEGFADAGSYPNLPCGGCAPLDAGCSGGQAYACWATSVEPALPASYCSTTGIMIQSNEPSIWSVCCRPPVAADAGPAPWSCSQGLCTRSRPAAACYEMQAPGWTCMPDTNAEAGACGTGQASYTCTSTDDGGSVTPPPCSSGTGALCCATGEWCPAADAGGPP
jgi:hypothetical protein